MYVHVPFCTRRCSYCDFAIAVRRNVPADEFLAAITQEVLARETSSPVGALKTLYLGGGTPSKLGPDGVNRLLAGLRTSPHLELRSDAEVTLEANPEDVTDAAASAWLAAGVTRLSVGIQSFDDAVLAWMHRSHDSDTASAAVGTARAVGFTDISLDLIFGLPASLGRDWAGDLGRALELEPDHLSLYGLTVEERTPLGRWTARGEVQAAPDDNYAQEFLLAHERLVASGLQHYEVSNFARAGRRSRHNSSYWRRVPYLGVGPSAHSFDGVRRRWNTREYEAWKAKALANEDPLDAFETLTPANVVAEAIYLGLRTEDGLGLEPGEEVLVAPWVERGWAGLAGQHLGLSAEGWLRLDRLAADLTAARSR